MRIAVLGLGFMGSRCRKWTQSLTLAVCALSASVPLLPGADQSDLPDRVQRAYYSLKRAGLVEFRCQVLPDWEALYANVKTDAAGEEVLKVVKSTHFEVAVGADGAPAVSHQVDGAPPSQELADRLRQVTGGVEQMLTGFFQVWSQFMYESVLSPNSTDVRIEDLDGRYQITQKQGQTTVVISMNRELLITEAQIDLPDVGITLHPRFAKQPKGYLLIGYEGKIRTASSSVGTDLTLENQDIQGFELPKSMTAVLSAGVRIRLNFTGCEIKKRNPSAPN